jgi:hypothetical protein
MGTEGQPSTLWRPTFIMQFTHAAIQMKSSGQFYVRLSKVPKLSRRHNEHDLVWQPTFLKVHNLLTSTSVVRFAKCAWNAIMCLHFKNTCTSIFKFLTSDSKQISWCSGYKYCGILTSQKYTVRSWGSSYYSLMLVWLQTVLPGFDPRQEQRIFHPASVPRPVLRPTQPPI